MDLMYATLPALLRCSLLSGAIAFPSTYLFGQIFIDRLVYCAMSSGCSEGPEVVRELFSLLLLLGMLSPFLIFPFGAYRIRHAVAQAGGGEFLHLLVLTLFAAIPYGLLLMWWLW